MRSQRLRAVSGVFTRYPACHLRLKANAISCSRRLHIPSRNHLGDFWIPQINVKKPKDGQIDVGQLLIQAGYLRQAYAGIFHILPLGLRVQNKIEALIDKHMQSLSASKVSLSSITSQRLWQQSGRLDKNSEFFRFKDRKDAAWLLAPTHEEEITSLVRSLVHAPGHLPLRLYQISRKYRDEKRPRGGLLRGREFIMKDLYTFDKTEPDAHETYAAVREAYNNIFAELKLPYIEARADSGNMGGTKSHEFHFPSNLGEDDIITCSKCDYAKNEEFVPPLKMMFTEIDTDQSTPMGKSRKKVQYEAFISKDKTSLVKAYVSSGVSELDISCLNPFVVKKCLSDYVDIDTGIEDAEAAFSALTNSHNARNVYYLFDDSTSEEITIAQVDRDRVWLYDNCFNANIASISGLDFDRNLLLKKRTGDQCPVCTSKGENGRLTVTKAIEVAHTFHLGTRYSSKLDLLVPGPQKDGEVRHVEMGCHGIGVSRLIAAAASAMSDEKGLIWPRAIAPFEVVIMILRGKEDAEAHQTVANQIYDDLASHTSKPADAIIDDRDGPDPGWKFRDAVMIGYPVVMAIGRQWRKDGLIEIECRRLNLKELVPLKDAASRVRTILSQL